MPAPSTAATCGRSAGEGTRAPPGIQGALIVRYLATNPAFEGIGAARASHLWESFGPELYRVLGSGDAEALATVIGDDRAQGLAAAWKESLAEADVVVWLDEQGFDARLGAKAVRFWGRDALARLRANPYVLMALAGWSQVDAAARRLGIEREDERRQVAAVE
ncbi:MAG: helix-hairpin-helix domain-containing protein, partial [Acetobacteraceae bacterium]|nr:helix-hairpin-helix domain-containing protein [Acetobacteraceae bacterium]